MANQKNIFKKAFDAVLQFMHSFPVAAFMLMATGILLFAFPENAIRILLCIIGVFFVLYGVLRILALLFGREDGGLGILLLIGLFWNVAIIIGGAILISSPTEAIRFFAVVTGIYLIVDAVVRVYRMLMAHTLLVSRFGIRFGSPAMRIVFLIACAMIFLSGVALLAFPKESVHSIAILAGAALFLDGMQILICSRSERPDKNKKDEPIETTDYEDKTGQ